MNGSYLLTPLVLLWVGGAIAILPPPQQPGTLGIPVGQPLGAPASHPPGTTIRPLGTPVGPPFTTPPRSGGASTTSSTQLSVNGGCGSASGRSSSQGRSVSTGFDFCGVASASQTLRDAILGGDIIGTARTLVQSLDRNGLVAGLKIPSGFQLTKSPINRDKDPDVIVAKGIAQAALSDSQQINKYVDVIMKAALPKDLHNFTPTTQKLVSYGECSLSLSARSSGQQVRVSEGTNCHQALVNPFKLQQDLIRTLSNRPTMQFILNADPDTTARRRSLKCVNCRRVDSFTCAQCWPKALCSSFFWCQ